MSAYVWRVPTLFGVMACSALVLFAGAVTGAAIVRRHPSAIVRVLTAVALALLALLSVVFVGISAMSVARALEIDVAHVDPGLPGYLAPGMFAAFAFTIARRALQGVWTSRAALLFYVWLVCFTAANVVNWCSRGWCTTIGFPFPWYSWSDAIFNDDGSGTSRTRSAAHSTC